MSTRSFLILVCGLLASCNTSESCDCVGVEHDIQIVRAAVTSGPNAFSPPNFAISLATQTMVTWWNRDLIETGSYGNAGVTHRLVSDDGTTFTSGNILPNGTFVATLSAPGSYAYHCSVHPAMTGTVTVNP